MNFIFLFLVSTALGSFTHACAVRYTPSLPGKLSCCDYCHHPLPWKDKLPILSFTLLKGRCRYCHTPLDLSLLVFELISPLFAFILYSNGYSILFYFAFLTLLYAAKVDWSYHFIPDRCHFLLALFAIPLLPNDILYHLILASLYPLALLPFAHHQKIGWGDIKLLFSLGFFTGFTLLVNLIIVSCTAALYHSFFKLKQPIPFAPYLLFGFVFCIMIT
ncbi:MAG: prepilin peptidase [Anaerorhabdus sp.]